MKQWMKQLDMRGQPCPIPVVKAKKALADDAALVDLIVWVDNTAAVQNLGKMAAGLGYAWSSQSAADGHFMVRISRGAEACPDACPEAGVFADARPSHTGGTTDGTTVLFSRDQLGEGERSLGVLLLKGFIFALSEQNPPPSVLVFLNRGIHLVCEGSAALADLQAMEKRGTRILVCGTCLNYYERLAELRVGEVADMLNIAAQLTRAERTLSL